mgnify:CR=1 FL=1
MKKTKLLAATAMLLLTSCSPKVVTHIVRTYPNPVPADSVYVIEPGDTVPNTAETLGSVSVVDRGTSRNCRYDQVLRLAQEATGKNGGNGLAITEHVKPSFWGSSCHQINALMLRLTDMVPASCLRRSFRRGKSSKTFSLLGAMVEAGWV